MNNQNLRLLVVYGTRPELIKLASLIKVGERFANIDIKVYSTGQHVEMLQELECYFGVNVDFQTQTMERGQSLNNLFSKVLESSANVMSKFKPDCVVVQGDTTSAAAAALSAFHLQIPVVHIEAGLRTFNINSPFPEEMNRSFIDSFAEILFAPTELCYRNLKHSRKDALVKVVGNTGIDALHMAAEINRINLDINKYISERYEFLLDSEFILFTQHRRENHGDRLNEVLKAAKRLAESGMQVIFLEHFNWNVQNALRPFRDQNNNLIFLPPQNYGIFVELMNRAKLIVTDSGGVQEEAPYFDIPLVITRDITERWEVLTFDNVLQVNLVAEEIIRSVDVLISKSRARKKRENYIYGDGNAAERILNYTVSHFQNKIRTGQS